MPQNGVLLRGGIFQVIIPVHPPNLSPHHGGSKSFGNLQNGNGFGTVPAQMPILPLDQRAAAIRVPGPLSGVA